MFAHGSESLASVAIHGLYEAHALSLIAGILRPDNRAAIPLATDARGIRNGLRRELKLLNPFTSKSRRILDVDVTYLEMKERPVPPPEPPKGAMVMRAGYPSVAFYRYLYTEVGKRWLWYERRKLSDSELANLLSTSRHPHPRALLQRRASGLR